MQAIILAQKTIRSQFFSKGQEGCYFWMRGKKGFFAKLSA